MHDPRPIAWMNSDLAMFRDAVRRFLADEAVPNDERWQKQRQVDREFYLKAGSMGMLCPSIPEEYGGGGGNFAHEAIVNEELNYIGCSSFAQGVHGTICAHYILAYGNEEQKQRWLPKLCSGEWICAIAMTEPGTGTDLQAVKTRAIRDGDHYVLNGSKIFISNGQLADLIIVVAKTDPSQGAKGISLIVVEADKAPGFTRGRTLEKLGMHGQDTAELFFEDVRVPVANLLGSEGRGFAELMNQLPQERLTIAVGAQACIERAVGLTRDYVKQRKIFGQPMMELQNTRFKLAECETVSRVTRAFVDECVVKHIAGQLTPAEASMAKYWATDQLTRVIDECLQLHGGYGYMMEYAITRMYADTRVQRIYGGANEVMKELIARSL
ncbi:MAG: acyl-CoA dehydrogenase family protein [Bradyrhizobium sp.]|nr:acyl-CoA dehydrogenase family protein [Bradyrhizobium sp.]